MNQELQTEMLADSRRALLHINLYRRGQLLSVPERAGAPQLQTWSSAWLQVHWKENKMCS